MMVTPSASNWTFAMNRFGIDRPVQIAVGCIFALLAAGAIYSPAFLSQDYLLQQLQ